MHRWDECGASLQRNEVHRCRSITNRHLPRPLLRQTVKCAQPPHQRAAIDCHDAPRRETPLQHVCSNAIALRIVSWQQYDIISDVEVCIACREPLILIVNGWGHR